MAQSVGITSKLLGGKELMRKMDRIGGKSAVKIMRSALSAGLMPILKQARKNAPGKTIKKLLKKSVKKGKKRGTIVGKVYVGDSARRVKFQGEEVGFEFVANVLEFGSQKRGISAHKYLRGARESKAQAAISAMEKKANERMKAEWAKR